MINLSFLRKTFVDIFGELDSSFVVSTIEEISSNEKRSIISGPFGSNISSKFFKEEGIPVIRGNNLTEDNVMFIDDGFVYISKEKADELNTYAIENDLIFTAAGTIGQVGIIPKESKFNEYIISNKQLRVRLDLDEINPFYAYYWFSSEKINKYIKLLNTGSTIPLINLNILRSLPIPLPNKITQDKIANLILNIDKKISKNKQINHNLEQLAKSIYKHHFIDMKPYMLGGYIRESPLGIIPKDWSVQLIGEFVDDMKNGGTPRRGESAYWENGTIPWLKTGEINNNIILKSEEHITELGLKNSSAKLLPINSIIMALYGKGTAARIGLLKIEATTNQACCAMICNDLNKTLFLYLFLLFNQKEIENLASGSVQQNLSKDLIANLNLIVPPIEIIENLPFKEIFDTIANNYFEIEYLTNLRDTLLPKLMSGEVDVSKINCDLD